MDPKYLLIPEFLGQIAFMRRSVAWLQSRLQIIFLNQAVDDFDGAISSCQPNPRIFGHPE